MKIVPRADSAPRNCIISRRDDGPFVDTESYFINGHGLNDGRVYIQHSVGSEIGRTLGMLDKEGVNKLRGELSKARAEVDDLKSLLDEAESFEESARFAFQKLSGKEKMPGKPGPKGPSSHGRKRITS